jgi:hypothetical protein
MPECNFCGKRRPHVAPARICQRCAAGSNRDAWCDFCKKSTRTELAHICRDCAIGREGDAWCDFCKKTTNVAAAKICQNCTN